MYKRCDVCDSTEADDKLASDGIDEPIEGWHYVKATRQWRCNRCHSVVIETIKEMKHEESNPVVGRT